MQNRIIEKINFPEKYKDTSIWPDVIIDNLSPTNKEIYLKRKKAIDYLMNTDKKISEIELETSLKRSEIYRFLRRCLEVDNTGSIIGYRALIPYKRIKDYCRTDFPENNIDENFNYTGSFNLLLETYPSLKEFIINLYFNRTSSNKNIFEPKISIKNLHKKFINMCRELGIKNNEYPFNTDSLARKSLERFVHDLSTNYFIESAKRHGDQATMVAKHSGLGIKNSPMILRPLERVEFDGHRIDTSLSIIFTTPEGDEIIENMNRIWILSIVDIATRAIIGYHICLNKEYSSHDVLLCIRNAIYPWKKRELSITGLKYSEQANFPSNLFPEAEFGIWDEFCYDNAKANIAKNVKEKLTELVNCSINMGPVAVPVKRPIIERFFRTLEQNTFHRLPSTTGSGPTDPKRKNSEQYAIDFKITAEHLEEIADVAIAEYNATPHEGINNLSPLEVFGQRLNRGYSILQLNETNRSNFNFFSIKVERRICGSIECGRRPYIHYEGVRYTNEILNHSPHLINKKLTLLINSDDLRNIKSFLDDGSEFGNLYAFGKWGITPHDLRTRKAINKLKNNKIIQFTNMDDPIEIYQQFLVKEAVKNKTSRNNLASFKKGQKEKKEKYKDNIENRNDNPIVNELINVKKELPENVKENKIQNTSFVDARTLKGTITF